MSPGPRERLEGLGYEVLVFHMTGAGGRTLESLINAGMLVGVFDVTTTELADELVGGVFDAGPDRLRGAARTGCPRWSRSVPSTWSTGVRRRPSRSGSPTG